MTSLVNYERLNAHINQLKLICFLGNQSRDFERERAVIRNTNNSHNRNSVKTNHISGETFESGERERRTNGKLFGAVFPDLAAYRLAKRKIVRLSCVCVCRS